MVAASSNIYRALDTIGEKYGVNVSEKVKEALSPELKKRAEVEEIDSEDKSAKLSSPGTIRLQRPTININSNRPHTTENHKYEKRWDPKTNSVSEEESYESSYHDEQEF